MVMFSLLADHVAKLRSLAASPKVDVMDALNLPAQAQTLSDEAAQSQLALELVQPRTTEELTVAMQESKQAAASACRRKGHAFAAKPRHRNANGRQRRTQRGGQRKPRRRRGPSSAAAGVEGEAPRRTSVRLSTNAGWLATESHRGRPRRRERQLQSEEKKTFGVSPRGAAAINDCVTIYGQCKLVMTNLETFQ